MVCEIDKSGKSQDDPQRGSFIVQASVQRDGKAVIERFFSSGFRPGVIAGHAGIRRAKKSLHQLNCRQVFP
jgi:hypothetical protein